MAFVMGGVVLTFGIGWGASGFCPGPAVTSVATGALPVLLFVGGMLIGMLFLQGHNRLAGEKPKATTG